MTKSLLIACCCFHLSVHAQSNNVRFKKDKAQKKVDVMIGGKYFTSFIFPDNLEKPVLFPIYSANGQVVTRGFPLAPRDGERNDHPHHVGLWLNYESVNGLDFWNNSYQIPTEKKSNYGWIRNVKLETLSEKENSGNLAYTANWERQSGAVLLREYTQFLFAGDAHHRIVDRITTLTAGSETVIFKDIKDGMLGLRVTKELELPSNKIEEFVDSRGNVTKVSASANGATGSYLTSEGRKNGEVWGTRGKWCLLSGLKEGQQLSVAIIDHPQNPGYPTYWHARDYGLFAANPLGQEIFSNGKEKLNLTLSPGKSVTFRYRVVITSGKKVDTAELDQQADKFASMSFPDREWKEPK